MNVVPLNATSPAAADQLANLALQRSQGQHLSGAALRNAAPEVQRAQVAQQFEAILVRQLLAPTMSSMLGKDGGASANVYGDMLTSTFAEHLTQHGGGMGLARMLAKQLAPRTPATAASVLQADAAHSQSPQS